jgi:hypothetical protein
MEGFTGLVRESAMTLLGVYNESLSHTFFHNPIMGVFDVAAAFLNSRLEHVHYTVEILF